MSSHPSRAFLVDLAARGGDPVEVDGRPVPWTDLWGAAGSFDPFPRGASRCAWRRARRDAALWRVHRIEQARLLAEAAQLVLAADPALGARWLGASVGSWDVWRGRARRELSLARASGVGAPRALLVACLWSPRLIGVDGARALARAAVALDPSPNALLALARARVLDDAVDAALDALASARRALGPYDVGLADLLERCRLLALERRGDLSAALAALGCLDDVDPALGQLALGLALGLDQPPEVERWATRLVGAPADPELLTALARRVAAWRPGLARRPVAAFALGDGRRAAGSVAGLFQGGRG